VALTKVAPALFGTGNNITSVTVGGSANTISLTFDGSGVITSATNNAVSVANTAITGNIISSQITSVANTQITGNITAAQITSVANTQLTGLIQAAQIGSANATLVTSGTLPTARLPTGTVLQVVHATTNTSLSATNQDVNTFNFECAITPLFSTSKMLVIASVNGIDNGGSGRFSTYIYQGTTSGGTSGTERINTQVAQDSTSTAGLSTTSISYLSSAIGSTTTQYFKILNSKNDGSTTWFVQRFNVYSSLVVMEIAA